MKLTTMIFILVVPLLFLAQPVRSQVIGGQVQGLITDESGTPLPGASIVARNTATDASRSTTSDQSGFYRISELRVGPYEFTVSLAGFSTQVRTGVTLVVGQQASLDFTLRVAPVAETITVEEDVPIVEPTKTSVGATITNKQIDDLPLRERDFTNLTELSPGITRSFTEATTISGSGSTGSSNTFLIDGVSNDQDALGNNRGDFSPDAISQFQVQSSQYQAEYGQAAGAIVNVLTKSGTNNFHGRLSLFYSADSLSASNPFAGKAPFDQTIGSGYFSGPLIKDKMFFFGSYEHTFRNDSAVVSVNRDLLAALGQNTAGSFPNPLREPRVLLKLDSHLSDNQTLSARYRLDKSTIENEVVGGTFTEETGVTAIEKNQDFAVNHTWILSQTTLNEFRFQFARQSNDDSEVNCPGCPLIIRPSVITGKLNNLPQTFVEDRYQFVDAFSFEVPDKAGDHFFKAGFDFSHLSVDAFVPQNFDGVFIFNTDQPFNAANPATYPFLFIGGTGNPNISITNNIYGLYFQDQWRVSPYFTLNLGLRWDYEDHLSIKQDKNNFGPRIHFAWDPFKDSKTSIRAGYGRYYDQIFLNSPLISSVFEPGRFTSQFILFPGFPDPLQGGQGIPVPQPPNLSVLDLDGKTPSKDTVSVGFQRELTPDMAITVDGIYARGHDLLLLRDANSPINGVRPDPTVGVKIDIETDGHSEYKALQLGLQRRFSNHYSVTLAYTLADNKDNTAGHRIFVSNSYDLEADFGPSDNDIRHTLNAAALFDIPWGFKLGFGTSATSAPDFNIITGNDTNQDGDLTDRAPGIPRNSGRGNPLWTVDARVSKIFNIGRAQSEFIVEAFNLFNRANKGVFQGNQQSADFGEPTDIVLGFEPRQVQVGVRVDF